MQNDIYSCITQHSLNPFNVETKTIGFAKESVLKTKEAMAVQAKVRRVLSSSCVFHDTAYLFDLFSLSTDARVIQSRQDFVKSLNSVSRDFLRHIRTPKPQWKPPYSLTVATAQEKTYMHLRKRNVPVILLQTRNDLKSLESYDVVQVVEAEEFSGLLEELPQVVFTSVEDVFLEQHLQVLSGYKELLSLLDAHREDLARVIADFNDIIGSLQAPLLLLDASSKRFSHDDALVALERVNSELALELKSLTLQGDALFTLARGSIPPEIHVLVSRAIERTGLPRSIFTIGVPVRLEEGTLHTVLREQEITAYSALAARIVKQGSTLKRVPVLLAQLHASLVYYDFIGCLADFHKDSTLPSLGDAFVVNSGKNLFLDKPQPISFHLTQDHRCSILTGANSGGKTTLLEHLLQVVVLAQMGFGVVGRCEVPVFSEVYYFAKNKGSTSKGAFETLLNQLAKIKPGKHTLILADEIEAVTEPGVAAQIISATCHYFTSRNCFLVIATHLGQEIVKNLPPHARVDGIEAKGLNEDMELIVDHNPVLGRLANSTPELIIEKLAKTQKNDYFKYLHTCLVEKK